MRRRQRRAELEQKRREKLTVPESVSSTAVSGNTASLSTESVCSTFAR